MDIKGYKSLLSEFVSFKSVSTDKAYISEIQKTVKWLEKLFSERGFSVEVIKGTRCNPVVFASYETESAKETVLVYGHYDVQPANKSDGWEKEPFWLNEKKGKLYARGVVDNKGQVLIHIFTVFELIKTQEIKYDVKFLIEGNEETSNDELADIIKKNKSKLKADYVLISDGEIPYKPSIEYSLRGGFNTTLKYTTAKNNLHSGIFGGAVPSAPYELTKFLSKLYNGKNKVMIPGFYKKADKVTLEQLKGNKKLLNGDDEIKSLAGVKTLLTEKGIDFYTQTGLRPTVQVTGLKSGYIGDGYSNIVPAIAEAKINFRVVTSQKPLDIYKAFERFVKKETPKFVKYELYFAGMHKPVKIDISSKKFAEARKLLKKAFNDEVLIKPVGGAIPVVSDFKEVLGVDTLLISLGNDDCNMHGVNENYDIGLIKKGLEFSGRLFGE